MHYFISESGEIVGTTDDPTVELAGHTVHDGPDAPPDALYFDGEKVAFKPDRPGENCFWSVPDRAWVCPEPPAEIVVTDWDGLVNSLRGTAVFAKIYVAATQPETNTIAALTKTLKANTGYTLLMDTLTKTHNLQDLQFALGQLRAALGSISTVGDFTADEIAWINERLVAHHFPIQLD